MIIRFYAHVFRQFRNITIGRTLIGVAAYLLFLLGMFNTAVLLVARFRGLTDLPNTVVWGAGFNLCVSYVLFWLFFRGRETSEPPNIWV